MEPPAGTERRLAGPHPVAVLTSPWQLQLREENPWLAEGFAEWATEALLRPAGASAAWLRFDQAEKHLASRTAIRAIRTCWDTSVRSVAHARSDAALRDLLVATLHDLAAFGHAAGLPRAAGAAITLQRPPTAIVIPEVSFTWVEGTAFDLSPASSFPPIARSTDVAPSPILALSPLRFRLPPSLPAQLAVRRRPMARGHRPPPRCWRTSIRCRRMARRWWSAPARPVPQGKRIPYVILSRPQVTTPAAAHATGKPILYIEGNIHAGEVEGKEAVQMLGCVTSRSATSSRCSTA